MTRLQSGTRSVLTRGVVHHRRSVVSFVRGVVRHRISLRRSLLMGDNYHVKTYRYADLVAEGLPEYEIRAMVRSGELTRTRHGGYLRGLVGSAEDAHHALIATTVPSLASDSVLSHQSAGLLWGLPVPRRMLDKVHSTRLGASGGNVTETLHSHRRELSQHQVQIVAGYQVTALARTAVDLASRTLRHESLAVLDAALRLGCSPLDLAEELDAAARRRGVGQVRWALPHADGRAESPGESISRYWMIVGSLPMPELQFELRDEQGILLGRTDFAWPDHQIAGEFDGRIKYDGSLGSGDQDLAEVIMAEKRRETNIFFANWRVIRWGMRELDNGPAFARRLSGYLGRVSVARPA